MCPTVPRGGEQTAGEVTPALQAEGTGGCRCAADCATKSHPYEELAAEVAVGSDLGGEPAGAEVAAVVEFLEERLHEGEFAEEWEIPAGGRPHPCAADRAFPSPSSPVRPREPQARGPRARRGGWGRIGGLRTPDCRRRVPGSERVRE